MRRFYIVVGMDYAVRESEENPVPVEEALPIARQIAEALEAAHEHGVVHRDLKPANIKLAADGTVKVLDFGLAKALGPAEAGHYVRQGGVLDRSVRLQPDLTASPTITSPATTALGVILGTAAYMAPEQAKGWPADKRADVWTFGCVLYEMLTGRGAFAGDDVSDTLANVLKREPDWNTVPADVPPAISALLKRCLEKDRRKRPMSKACTWQRLIQWKQRACSAHIRAPYLFRRHGSCSVAVQRSTRNTSTWTPGSRSASPSWLSIASHEISGPSRVSLCRPRHPVCSPKLANLYKWRKRATMAPGCTGDFLCRARQSRYGDVAHMNAKDATADVGGSVPLFTIPAGATDDAARDGQRFLVNAPTSDAEALPITVDPGNPEPDKVGHRPEDRGFLDFSS